MESTYHAHVQPHERLAELLMTYRHEVERRWLASIAVQLQHHGLNEPELRDSIPDYVEALADSLRRLAGDDRGGRPWLHIARKHAVLRIHHGFDVGEVLREFTTLRRQIIAVLREHTELTVADVELLSERIGGALAAAVQSYVDSRDFEGRRQQAQHIGFLTHELRNPLATAMIAVGQIRLKGAEMACALDQPLQFLERSLRRLRELIDETLLAQRLDAHAVECAPRPVRLGELLDEALDAARATAAQKGISFAATFDPEIIVTVDRKLAVSAVQNIVDNATKFTDHGRVDVIVEDSTSEIVVHVHDECDGLSHEELKTIFEPFKRGHQGKSGTGLGLAIARRAVEAHGKTIQADSREGQGCHFWFGLPKPNT